MKGVLTLMHRQITQGRLRWCLVASTAFSLLVNTAFSDPDFAEDFGLFDTEGNFHWLGYYKDDAQTKAFVLFIQGNGCPLVQKRIPELNRLNQEYSDRGIRFWMINPNSQDTRAEVADEMKEFGSEIPVLMDSAQLVAQTMGIERTAQALLVKADDWTVLYRGAIDDRLSYESERPEAGETYLRDAIDGFLAGRPVEVASHEGPGCKVSFPTQRSLAKNGVTYSDDIGPMLRDNCVQCHNPTGIGPFSLSSYRKARGWSDMIREVVMTRRMPPWQADPHYGVFSNDVSLTDEERQKLVYWIDQGSPRGEGADPLAEYEAPSVVWPMGEPDHVLEMAPFEVPAEGIIDYQYVRKELPFDEPVWVSGFDVAPGEISVVHHVIAYVVKKEDKHAEGRRWLGGYAPGTEAEAFPEQVGVEIGPDEDLLLEMHYTASGKAAVDQTQIGIYLSDSPSNVSFKTGFFVDQEIEIPARDRNYKTSGVMMGTLMGEDQEGVFEEDIVLFSLFPHMHLRGKAMRFVLESPDGQLETLLSVPYYDFNWQRGYELEEPLRIPAGSRLHLTAAWDNSELNKSNPNPDRVVTWGEQSFDEMFFAVYRYVAWDDWVSIGNSVVASSEGQ